MQSKIKTSFVQLCPDSKDINLYRTYTQNYLPSKLRTHYITYRIKIDSTINTTTFKYVFIALNALYLKWNI